MLDVEIDDIELERLLVQSALQRAHGHLVETAGPGTVHAFTVRHVSSMLSENIVDYLVRHPTIAQDREAFRLAYEAGQRLAQLVVHIDEQAEKVHEPEGRFETIVN